MEKRVNGMILKHPRISIIIALTLSISVLTGCTETVKRGSEGEIISRSDGLSTGGQVGIGIGAAIAAIALGKLIYDTFKEDKVEEKVQNDWVTNGPVMAAQFTLSNLTVNGFVKGGWPIAVDFQLNRPGPIFLSISSNKVDPYSIAMNGSQTGRQLQVFHIPSEFGTSPQNAQIRIHAADKIAGTDIPLPAKIFGIACGPNAVGSIGIDQINFGPGSIQLSLQQKATYFFFSHKSFDKVSVAFRKVEDRNGIIGISNIVKEETIKMPAIDESIGKWIGTKEAPRIWNGETRNNQPSQGLHVLQIRAWFSDPGKQDWGVSLSPDWVEVKK
jgi:hypothetical protein